MSLPAIGSIALIVVLILGVRILWSSLQTIKYQVSRAANEAALAAQRADRILNRIEGQAQGVAEDLVARQKRADLSTGGEGAAADAFGKSPPKS